MNVDQLAGGRVRITITIPVASPSINDWNGRKWYRKNELKEEWYLALWCALGNNRPKAKGKRQVRIERHSPRELDTDNLWGGVKPILDALVKLGLLVDDKPKWCGLLVVPVFAYGEDARTVIVIEDDPQPSTPPSRPARRRRARSSV